jgi:hypothetical protein
MKVSSSKLTKLTKGLVMRKSLLFTAAVAAAVVLSGVKVYASSWAQIEGQANNSAATLDSASGAYPVITAIGSQPGTFGAYSFTKWAIFSQDSSGAGDIYSALPAGPYTSPTVGDAISAVGTYSPYSQIPEISPVTSITLQSSGNTVPTPNQYSVEQLSPGTIAQSMQGYVLTLTNVMLWANAGATIAPSGNFPTGKGNTTLYAEDDALNTLEVYVWASSYSVDAAWAGTPQPTGGAGNYYDITGIVDNSNVNYPAEMVPFSITLIPEPTTIALVGTGLLGMFLIRRRRR